MLEGRKTYISLAIALVGILGWGSYISPAEVTELVNVVLTFAGIAGAVYGRAVAKV